jgi:F420-dependent oxidoreductase-like protein
MLEVAVMIEGQNGLNWPRWKQIATTVEGLGFVGLFRSDHYTNARPPDKDSLELWVSLAWLASHTDKLEFGPLVSPVSFRHPTMTARMARDVDALSNGRLILGLGAGWQEREHHNYGWDLLSVPDRMDRFEEGLEVITHLLRNEAPMSFEGRFFQLREASLLPRPLASKRPPILIGGNGKQRTMPLVVQFADEWNGLFLNIKDFQGRITYLNSLCEQAGRSPNSIRRSLMTGLVIGQTDEEIREKANIYRRSPEELKEIGAVVIGSPSQVVDHLGRLEEVGCDRVMLQWLSLDELSGLELLAKEVLPQL